MQLNHPLDSYLTDCKRVLIAGAGGGFDVFAGLPLYFALREQGYEVHLANYSFVNFGAAKLISRPQILIDTMLIGARGGVIREYDYYPEGFLAQWFEQERGEDVTVWMFNRVGVLALLTAYRTLVEHLGGVDAIILVDGGVDALMRGDETGPGTLLEDSISLAAVEVLEGVRVKILANLGFGTEVEEAVCHHHALENIAALAMEGAFWGGCALTPQMEAFQLYEAACRYVWEQPTHYRSHISTRVIPAVQGHFDGYRMYDDPEMPAFLSPLMSLYWFTDAQAVARRNLLIEELRDTYTFDDASRAMMAYRMQVDLRPRKNIPY